MDVSKKILAGLALLALVAFAIWPWLPWNRNRLRTVVLYGFSILGESLNQAIFPAFQARWLAKTGEHVELVSSFAGSGTITNQIKLGVPAQVAILSTGLDALKLVEAGRVPGDSWQALPAHGIVNRTPFVILVRPGNPRGIHDFADLARPGVRIVHPDPLTSGGAQWAILAEYGSCLRRTRSPQKALEQLRGIWMNVVSQAGSARAARTQFESGLGDVLITYEQELVRDASTGKLVGEIVYPPSTILSEHLVVTLPHNIADSERDLVQGFVDFLWSDEAQHLFA